MNLFRAGRARSFQPKFFQDRTGIEVIRPLVTTRETLIVAEAHRLELPILATTCPYAGKTERQRTKEMLAAIGKQIPDLFSNVMNALKTIDASDRWQHRPNPTTHQNGETQKLRQRVALKSRGNFNDAAERKETL
jgi:tRNA(Ile)-lysidine synthase TilS/MesJ